MKIIKDKKPINEAYLHLMEDVGDEDIEVSDGGATVEAPVKMTSDGDSAQPVNKKEALKIDNALTRVLDDALFASRRDARRDIAGNNNVLVTGLPGSSKTATIMNWCRANGLNVVYLDAKNPDLNALLSGSASIDKTNPENPVTRTAYSDALNDLDKPNSVLFLDELNRQIKQYLRGSLLTLIADKRVAGKGEGGFRYFPNLLFTVAAVNPAKSDDKGTSDLNDAERRRFPYKVEFHSETETTKVYLNAEYDQRLRDIAEVEKQRGASPENPDAFSKEGLEDANSDCLSQWIGLKIISDPDFYYTKMTDYDNGEEGTIMCQSAITDLVDHCYGDLDRLLRLIKLFGLRKSGEDMLIKIVNKIKALGLPSATKLRAKKAKDLGIYLGPTDLTPEEAAADDAAATDGKAHEEVDDDDFSPEDFEKVREDDPSFTAGIDADKAKAAKISDVAATERLKKVLGL